MEILKKLVKVEFSDATGSAYTTEENIESGNLIRTEFTSTSALLEYMTKNRYDIAIGDILLC